MSAQKNKRICITGAAGYVGRLVTRRLIEDLSDSFVLASDLSPPPEEFLKKNVFALSGARAQKPSSLANPKEKSGNEKESHKKGASEPSKGNFLYLQADIRKADWKEIFQEYKIDCVVHLASIVNPGRGHKRTLAYEVDVEGSKRILLACVEAGVQQIIVTSSGAAYGYHKDNPVPLRETDPLRGNREFAYSYHKRLVEEMLAEFRTQHPKLRQLIFRPGTILGPSVQNQITALFQKNPIPAIRGKKSPFVFISDSDVVEAILQGITEEKTGIYNLAGDGTLSIDEIGKGLGHKVRHYPEWILKAILFFLRLFRLTPYGPEQTRFLAYRPVLANDRLKAAFFGLPSRTSKEVFEDWLRSNASKPHKDP